MMAETARSATQSWRSTGLRHRADGLLARSIERAYLAVRRPQPCRRRLNPDLFDGRRYTIDQFYAASQPLFDRPCDFFRTFGNRQPLSLRPARAKRAYCSYVFDSPILTPWPENNLVPFKWFTRPGARSRTILLFAPGWARASQRFEEHMAAALQRRGIDVGLLTKPFHQARAPLGTRSGEYFISANLFWTVANFRQFTAEIRQLIAYMRERYDHIALLGMSSGAFCMGLASDCEPVDILFTLIGGCDVAGITWSGSATRWIRRELSAEGVDEAALRRAWSICDQAVLGRHCQARYRKHYIAHFDSIVPPIYQEMLWDVYGRPDRVDLDASHVTTLFWLPRIVDDMVAFVRTCVSRSAPGAAHSGTAHDRR